MMPLPANAAARLATMFGFQSFRGTEGKEEGLIAQEIVEHAGQEEGRVDLLGLKASRVQSCCGCKARQPGLVVGQKA